MELGYRSYSSGFPRTVLDLEDSSRTKNCGLGLERSGLGLGLDALATPLLL